MYNIDKFIKQFNDLEIGSDEYFEAHQFAIDSNDPELIYRLAVEGKAVVVELLQNAIIKTNNAEFIYYFAKDVLGADIELLQDAIIKTRDEYYISLFAKNVKSLFIDLDLLYESLKEIHNEKQGECDSIENF